jgi:hypothetical protein
MTFRTSRIFSPDPSGRVSRTCQRREALLGTGVRDGLLRAGTATASSSSASSGCAPSAASRLMPAFARDDSFSSAAFSSSSVNTTCDLLRSRAQYLWHHGLWHEAGQVDHEGSHMPHGVDGSSFDVPRVGVAHPTGRLAVRCEARPRVLAVVDFEPRPPRKLAEPHRSIAARIGTGLTVAPCK